MYQGQEITRFMPRAGFRTVVLLLLFGLPVSAAPPAAVDDLRISTDETMFTLDWSRPAFDTEGNPLVLSHYNIYSDTTPRFVPGPSNWLSTVDLLSYTAAINLDAQYFQITTDGETVVPLSGLLAYYPFRNDGGDCSGNGYHGELVGGATTAGLLHIGDNDQDCALLPSEVFDGLQDFTVSASIRIETLHTSCASGFTPVHTLLNCGTHSLINTFWIGYLPLTHQWLLHIYGNNLIDFFPLPEDVWLHLTFSRNGNQLRLFLDGYLFYNQPASYGGTVEVEPGGAVIGQDQDSFGGMFEACQSLAGGIASLRVYERALSEAEVFQLYLQDRMVLP